MAAKSVDTPAHKLAFVAIAYGYYDEQDPITTNFIRSRFKDEETHGSEDIFEGLEVFRQALIEEPHEELYVEIDLSANLDLTQQETQEIGRVLKGPRCFIMPILEELIPVVPVTKELNCSFKHLTYFEGCCVNIVTLKKDFKSSYAAPLFQVLADELFLRQTQLHDLCIRLYPTKCAAKRLRCLVDLSREPVAGYYHGILEQLSVMMPHLEELTLSSLSVYATTSEQLEALLEKMLFNADQIAQHSALVINLSMRLFADNPLKSTTIEKIKSRLSRLNVEIQEEEGFCLFTVKLNTTTFKLWLNWRAPNYDLGVYHRIWGHPWEEM
ncbi:unnamed protein product [Bursaphelenchus xylophilus]|uniref:(pine wood nematode) hypothetical protein n=1 Tax=Bursaphelenchus xylophilus TaxID=6326 RepID=A0A7I8WY77_BURXY|nr:unnamed protein product [Bursaphelenchus xylophilus]CAG9100728.1 unnamed protein product [Bursaphelenchus xylophilus]